MAHFARIRAFGNWISATVLEAAEMELLDAHLAKSVNGDEGGTWAPAAAVTLGGLGLRVTGPSRLDDLTNLTTSTNASLVVSADSAMAFNGSELDFNTDSSCGFNDNAECAFNATSALIMQGTSTATWSSGTSATWHSGSTALFSGTVNLSGTSMNVTTGKTLHINAGGQIQFDSGSTIDDNGSTGTFTGSDWTFTGGSSIAMDSSTTAAIAADVTFNSGNNLLGTLNLKGDLSVKSGASVAYNSGSVSTWGSGSTFQINDGADASIDATVNIGDGAQAFLNFATSFGGGVTFNLRDVNDGDYATILAGVTIVHISTSVTNTTTINLSHTGAHQGDIKIVYTGPVTTGNVVVQDSGSDIFDSGTGGDELRFGGLFVYGGSAWRTVFAVNITNGKVNFSA